MGSGASKGHDAVTGFSDSGERKASSAQRVRPSLKREVTKVTPFNETGENINELEDCKDKLAELTEKIQQQEKTNQQLEADLTEVEGQRLDVLDRVALLEGGPDPAEGEEGCHDNATEALELKDAHIEQLQQQLEAAQQLIHKQKLRFKKKMRAANCQLAETKQAHALQKFEAAHKEESTAERADTPDDAVCANSLDQRTAIILDLSSRVSDQEKMIDDLRQQIEEQNSQIQLLQVKHSGGAVDGSAEVPRLGSGGRPPRGNSGGTTRLTSNSPVIQDKKDNFKPAMPYHTSLDSGVTGIQDSDGFDFPPSADFGQRSRIWSYGLDSDPGIDSGDGLTKGNCQSPVDRDYHIALSSDEEDVLQTAVDDLIQDSARSLDKNSIRQISAAKLRKSKKKQTRISRLLRKQSGSENSSLEDLSVGSRASVQVVETNMVLGANMTAGKYPPGISMASS